MIHKHTAASMGNRFGFFFPPMRPEGPVTGSQNQNPLQFPKSTVVSKGRLMALLGGAGGDL